MSNGDELPQSCQHTKGRSALPATVEEAVKILIDELPLKDKVAIANASAEAVGELTIDLVNVIRNAFGLSSGNQALVRSCAKETGGEIAHPDDAAAVIMARLVLALAKTHKLRSV